MKERYTYVPDEKLQEAIDFISRFGGHNVRVERVTTVDICEHETETNKITYLVEPTLAR